jgi:hypothetical protein
VVALRFHLCSIDPHGREKRSGKGGEEKRREEKTSYYRANFGRGCVLGDVVM